MLPNRPTPSVRSRVALALSLVGALTWGESRPAAAQDASAMRDPTIADSVFGRYIVTSRHSGPPGTEVTLQPMYLPSVTPVQISIGGTRSGFEVLAQMMTNQQGELSEAATFRVPEWAERDRTYMFMVLDLYFKPLAASSPFYVTGPDGTLVRHGRITDEGKSCVALRGEGNELYSLRGRTGTLTPGDSVLVEGRIVESSACPRGPVIEVVRVQRLNRSAPAAGASPTLPASRGKASPSPVRAAPSEPARRR